METRTLFSKKKKKRISAYICVCASDNYHKLYLPLHHDSDVSDPPRSFISSQSADDPQLILRLLSPDGTTWTLMWSVQEKIDYAKVHGRRNWSNWQQWLKTDPCRKRTLMVEISALLCWCWWNVWRKTFL